jgi:hypothetical protein
MHTYVDALHRHPRADRQAALLDQILDLSQPLDVLGRVEPQPPLRARRLDKLLSLVFPQRLRVHVQQPRGDADDIDRSPRIPVCPAERHWLSSPSAPRRRPAA